MFKRRNACEEGGGESGRILDYRASAPFPFFLMVVLTYTTSRVETAVYVHLQSCTM